MISFIVPIFNVEQYLGDCIDSLLAQTYPAIEIILVDDGSTDHSPEICDRYSELDTRIKVVHQNNKGLSGARNEGLKQATGKWVSFVDADDWVEKEFADQILKYGTENMDICCFAYRDVWIDKVSNYVCLNVKYREYSEKDIPEIQVAILNKYLSFPINFMSACMKAYRLDFLRGKGLFFDEKLRRGEDSVFNLIAYSNMRKGCYVNYIGYNYRQNTQSMCRAYNSEITEQIKVLLDKIENSINSETMMEHFNIRVVREFMICTQLDFCNPKNKRNFGLRRREFFQEYYSPIFLSAIKEVKTDTLPIREKILVFLIKRKMFMLVDLLFVLKNMKEKM